MHSSLRTRFVPFVVLAVSILSVCLFGTAARCASEQELKEFIGKIQNENADVRYAAWRSAGPMGAPAVAPLGELVASENRGVAKAASEALKTIAHHASRPGAAAERKAVSAELVKLLAADKPFITRVRALELLALTADDEFVPPIARLLDDEKLREDARRALERIPGRASVQALVEALSKVPENFRPFVIHSLGQKNAVEALDTLVTCAESSNKPIAVAAYDAISRIDGLPTRRPQPAVGWEELSEREKVVVADAFLRFADRRVASGDTEMAAGIYRAVLARATGEHYKCAGLIGLAKIGSASVVEMMVPCLTDESPAVRRVAEEALVSTKDPGINPALEQAMQTAAPELKDAIAKVLFARKAGPGERKQP